jgi:hypothetical protein
MPRKATEAAATAKPKPAAKTRAATPRKTKASEPIVLTWEHVAERAYYIHLEEGGDAIENWLRAERELVAV